MIVRNSATRSLPRKQRPLLALRAFPSLQAERNDVPAELDAVFRRMVAKQVDDRYGSMTDAIRDLQACRDKHGSRWIMQTLAARRKSR